ncbi:GntR family transcriptional regulator [Roseomonas sp. F4]
MAGQAAIVAIEQGFTPVAGETLPELVAAQVYAALIEGRIPPGSRLSEASIARAMGLSRGPVREGLRLLERKGLCEFRARRGFFLRSLTRAGIDDLFRVRAMLEQHGLTQAMHRSDADFSIIAAWRDRLIRADRAGPPASPAMLVEEDLALHALIVRLSGNATLIATFEVVLAETRLALSVVNQRLRRLARVAAHHEALVDALVARDLTAASAELTRHLDSSRQGVLQRLTALDEAETKQRRPGLGSRKARQGHAA